MLTREQKRWLLIGHCTNTGDTVGCLMCKMRHICDATKANYADFGDEELNVGLNIIAPNVLEEPKRGSVAQWISVGDKLPDIAVPVIICRKRVKDAVKVEEGCLDGNGWWLSYGVGWTKSVTHWMPLPEPPEMCNSKSKE